MPRHRPHKHLPDGTINPLWKPVKKSRRRLKPVVLTDMRANALASPPFLCANCDEVVESVDLFCSFLCRDEAKYVRYYRKKIEDGTFTRKDVQDALRFRLAHILAGGYDVRLRRVPDYIRRAVIERACGICQNCGEPGSELDHIDGSSSEPENLQWLCSDCHGEKTSRNLRRVSRKKHPEMWAKAQSLKVRAWADEAVRLCDDPVWESVWRAVRSARIRANRSSLTSS